jgi:hypothetical protein
VGSFQLDFPLSTDVQSRSITPDSPQCRQTGYTSLQCLCDTCNNAAQEACARNADCPSSGGADGICGGRRCITGSEIGRPCLTCLGGSNHGATCSNASACPGGTCPLGCGALCVGGTNADAPCTTNSECPGSTCQLGQCNRPGEQTQPNGCADDTTTPGILPLCVPTGGGEGACAAGPIDQRCSVDDYVSCSGDGDCVPTSAGGPCGSCSTTGQRCVAGARECFTDSGVPGRPVEAVGTPSVPCEGVARPTLAALTCTQTLAVPYGVFNNAFNIIHGLPGLSRIRMPVEIAE